MAIHELNQEQIRTWTIEQKDRWWYENVYKGDMPQLTLRSAITGFFLGAVLCLTNLYIGAKTGWSLGMGITSVIMSFGLWRALSKVGIGRDITLLENNCTQSIATSAGYMTAPLVSSLAAYMLVTDSIIPMHHVMIWLIVIAFLGVLFAFPMKRRFINDEQHPFPEGRACGVVLDTLHSEDPKEGVFKAKLLAGFGGVFALIELMKSEAFMLWIKAGFHVPTYPDGWFYRLCANKFDFVPAIGGVSLKQLTIRPDTEFALMAAGGLMGIRTGVSLLVGAILNYAILAPIYINNGDISPATNADGSVKEAAIAYDMVEPAYGFGEITKWALWCGVAMMTMASLFSFFSKPEIFLTAFKGLGRKREERSDVLRHIELPMKVFVIGIPVVGAAAVLVTHLFFGVNVFMGALAVPLVFVFSLIGANSTALTGITPTGALGKLTQLTYAVLQPGNIRTNLMTAGIASEAASNASNLMMDIKPGYMLGAKPRQQALGHSIGIFAGALAAVPVFYLAFLDGDLGNLTSEEWPMPAAQIWRGVAEALTGGLHTLQISARWWALVGAFVGLTMEILRRATKGRFWLSPVAVGLAFVIAFHYCFTMFLGSFIFWLIARFSNKLRNPDDPSTIRNQEPICAGVIAGAALMGITVKILETTLLDS